MKVKSLRSRLVIGSTFWIIFSFVISSLISTAISIKFHRLAARVHFFMLGLAALLTIIAGLAGIRRGLSPFDQLRRKLAAVREGYAVRVEGDYPTEVQPMVDDLNELLDDREKRVARALSKAGDLAHGLKTPLAVLYQEAERAEADGHMETASTMMQQVLRMRRQIDYHLAQARAGVGASPGARCGVLEATEGLSRTLLRLYAARGLNIDVNVSAEHSIRGRREDLEEMLGNLLDNACKWAKSRVVVSSTASDGTVTIAVDDDGPGLAAELREAVLQRGVRGDEAPAHTAGAGDAASHGHGFGLAIVRDLADLYGGSIALGASPQGGLRASLQLPS